MVMPAALTAFTQIHTALSYPAPAPRTWGRCRHSTTRMPTRNRSSARTKARCPRADPYTQGTRWPLTPNMYVRLSDISFLCVYVRCICMCMYVCVCVCMYVCMYYARVCVCVCLCVYLNVCICIYVCMHVCVYACMYVSMCVCMYMHVCRYVFLFIYIKSDSVEVG